MKTTADLPYSGNKIYHLNVSTLASDILLVGDPERAHWIGKEFLNVEDEMSHRGLCTVTGKIKGTKHRVSIVTTGMGTPSAEIVLNEIVALAKRRKIRVIRVGTSGALQDTELGTGIITKYGIGLDNAGQFYKGEKVHVALCSKIKKAVGIQSYVGISSQKLLDSLQRKAQIIGFPCKVGMTATCPGFFAAQGRDVSKLKPSVKNLDKKLAKVRYQDLSIENMDMETAFILYFLNSLGHEAASLCVTIANRRKNTLDTDFEKHMRQAVKLALDVLSD